MEMIDRGKVIKGLRCLSNPYIQDMDDRDCENCKYDNASCFLDVQADALSLLKAQEPSKYEYHIDDTDCVWYGEDDNKCPATCSQYRDGWNDAMDYIYKGGKGYRPYKRR